MMKLSGLSVIICSGLLLFCSGKSEKKVVEVADTSFPEVQLPKGFSISLYASVDDARSLAVSPSGTVFVGNKSGDAVYALRDQDGDGKAEQKYTIAKGLNMPNGVAFRDGDLYVAEVSRILKFPSIEKQLSAPGKPVVVYDKFPTDGWHGWKYIAFGPDGKLYVPVGAPCNVCDKGDAVYASLTRMNPDGTGLEVFARGIRNTVGFTWSPENGSLWFTDNGRDMLGDDVPPCELNMATGSGQHFGFPYCHAGEISDPEFGNKRGCKEFTAPAKKLGAHVAPLGLKFYTGSMFPSAYKNKLFIAEHGSWNRSKKNGYKIGLATVVNGKVTAYETFASGWLNDESQKVTGRPVDILIMADGSMLVSDDKRGVVYRVTYKS